MPSNIEFKSRLQDLAFAHATARRLSGAPPEILHQTDVFFRCPQGRLKLRMFADGTGELIQYDRADSPNARRSDYKIARTPDAEVLLEILQQMLASVGTVNKTRSVYLVGQTRIHIDQVEKLGNFLEIEVVLKPGQSDSDGRQIADYLMREFGITPDQLMSEAYVDLLNRLVTI